MTSQVNEWIYSLRRDDAESQQAFENLYDTFYRPVFLLAVSITNDVSVAEDVAQEVFITVKKRAASFYSDSSGRAWIFSITRNLSRYFLRTVSSEQGKIRKLVEGSVEFEKDVLDGIVVSQALDVLNSSEYQTVLLHVFGGFSLREIADNTGVAYGTVLWRYHEARKKLKQYYEGGMQK